MAHCLCAQELTQQHLGYGLRIAGGKPLLNSVWRISLLERVSCCVAVGIVRTAGKHLLLLCLKLRSYGIGQLSCGPHACHCSRLSCSMRGAQCGGALVHAPHLARLPRSFNQDQACLVQSCGLSHSCGYTDPCAECCRRLPVVDAYSHHLQAA